MQIERITSFQPRNSSDSSKIRSKPIPILEYTLPSRGGGVGQFQRQGWQARQEWALMQHTSRAPLRLHPLESGGVGGVLSQNVAGVMVLKQAAGKREIAFIWGPVSTVELIDAEMIKEIITNILPKSSFRKKL